MTHSPDGATTTRRGFLALAGLTALSACAAPSGPKPGAAKATAAAMDKLTSLVPKFVPLQAVKPDITSSVPGFGRDGFLKYPTALVDSITAKPGKGGTYKVMVPTWSPLPPPLGSNSYYDAVNTDIGATIDFNYLDGMTIHEKLPTLLAGGDVADVTTVPGWALTAVPDYSKAVDGLFEDLTPYLAGDISSKYPALAAIPTLAWQYSVFSGKLKAVPAWPTPMFGLVLFHRKDLWDKLGLTAPKSADELFEMGKQATDPKAKRWAFSDVFEIMREIYRVPRKWRKEAGKLVHAYETPEYEATVAWMRKVVDAGLVHPNVLSAKQAADTKELFKSGQVLVASDGFSFWAETLIQMSKEDPDFWMEPLPVFGGDGGKPEYRVNQDPSYTFIKKGTPKEKIEELLSLFNYFSSPFGTQEQLLFNNGVEGKHFTRDAAGAPQQTELGPKEIVGSYVWLGGRIDPIFESQAHPNYVQAATTWWNSAVQVRHQDPFDGIRVQEPGDFTAAVKPFEDKVTDIIRGRRDVSTLSQAIDEWRKGGGDAGREFYQKVLTDNGRA
ncbi:lipoprotein [Acrocarpospora phusangensis]|uniref:Lipoprotein n=1 Tax=Acrocarpospora phusangensis TaxID=1070424 RepID=A0A919Q9I0_9ACTN|nr:extracellular solute-binding protein [Acrocarpospora phusangensis]GIH24503.1 lipoprotein [Acrocarpospora phusangensis]